jgi:hypothetical protein
MGSDEVLRMSAEVVDKFSVPLRDMQRQLRQLADMNVTTNKEGVRATTAHTESFVKLRDIVRRTTTSFKGELSPAISELGSISTGVGGAIAGIASAISAVAGAAVSFGNTTRHFRDLQRATNMAVNDLRAWEALGPRIGTSTQAMDAGLEAFTQHMERLNRVPAAELREWGNSLDAGMKGFVLSLRGLPTQDALEKLVHMADYIHDVTQRQRLWEGFGLPKEFATETAAEIDKSLADIRAHLKPWTSGDMFKGDQAFVAFAELRESLTNLKDEIGADFVAPVTTGITQVTALLEDTRKEMDELGAAIKGDFKFDWRALLGADQFEQTWAKMKEQAGAAAKLLGLDQMSVHADPKALQEHAGSFFGGLWKGYQDWHNSFGAPAPMKGWPADGGPMNLLHKESYSSPYHYPAGLTPAAFHPGGLGGAGSLGEAEGAKTSSTSDAVNIIAVGTRKGVADGLWDFFQAKSAGIGGPGAFGPGGSVTNAAYETGGSFKSKLAGDSIGGQYQASTGAGNLTKLITEAAARHGIDPRIMEGIRAGESGHSNRYDKNDSAIESSWGPFQLNRMRGLGVDFERDTAAERARLGLGDLRDPRTIPLQSDWVANYIKQHGTNGQWMGYRGPRDADARWGDSGYNPPGQTPTGGRFAIGDSIAQRIQQFGKIPGMGVQGAAPGDILARINAMGPNAFSGQNVLLSGGASNRIGDTQLSEKEINAIKARGARAIMLLGVGNRLDFQAAKVNDQLRAIAKRTGVTFEELGATDDSVHPTATRSGEIARDLANWPALDSHRAALMAHFRHGKQKPQGDSAGLLEGARKVGMAGNSTEAGRVTGDASLTVKLASGLAAEGGIKTSGDLFKETRLERGRTPYASTTG